ncbi:MAG: hypothetical protein ACOYVD_16220 [Bacillota bacterium]
MEIKLTIIIYSSLEQTIKKDFIYPTYVTLKQVLLDLAIIEEHQNESSYLAISRGRVLTCSDIIEQSSKINLISPYCNVC